MLVLMLPSKKGENSSLLNLSPGTPRLHGRPHPHILDAIKTAIDTVRLRMRGALMYW
jgi:hypothetical protein